MPFKQEGGESGVKTASFLWYPSGDLVLICHLTWPQLLKLMEGNHRSRGGERTVRKVENRGSREHDRQWEWVQCPFMMVCWSLLCSHLSRLTADTRILATSCYEKTSCFNSYICSDSRSVTSSISCYSSMRSCCCCESHAEYDACSLVPESQSWSFNHPLSNSFCNSRGSRCSAGAYHQVRSTHTHT